MARSIIAISIAAFVICITCVSASDDFATSVADIQFDKLKYKFLYPIETPDQREIRREMDSLRKELRQIRDAQNQREDRKALEMIRKLPTEDPIRTRLDERMNVISSTNFTANTNTTPKRSQ